MNYRIYVCSSSGINNISHPSTIKSISLILEPSFLESYLENNELNIDMFYTRARFDRRYQRKVKKRSTEEINEIIKKDKMDNMKIYILLSKFYSLEDANELSNDNVYAFSYDLYGNALMSMALSLNNSIMNNHENIFSDLNNDKNNYYSFYISLKNDMEYKKNDYNIENEIVKSLKKAKYYQISNGEFTSINSNFDSLINPILNTKNKVKVFIEYVNQKSNYISYIEKMILSKNPMAVIKKIQISPSFFNIIGEKAIGVGYKKI